jgi:hypothetical protein
MPIQRSERHRTPNLTGISQLKTLSFVLLLLVSLTIPAFAQVLAGDIRIYYYRPDGNYSGWAIYTWNASTSANTWCSGEVQTDGSDSFGIYFDVPVNPTFGSPAGQLGFTINNCADGQIKDPGVNQYLQVTEYSQGWVVSANPTLFYSQPAIGDTPIPRATLEFTTFVGIAPIQDGPSTVGMPLPRPTPGALGRHLSAASTAMVSTSTFP